MLKGYLWQSLLLLLLWCWWNPYWGHWYNCCCCYFWRCCFAFLSFSSCCYCSEIVVLMTIFGFKFAAEISTVVPDLSISLPLSFRTYMRRFSNHTLICCSLRAVFSAWALHCAWVKYLQVSNASINEANRNCEYVWRIRLARIFGADHFNISSVIRCDSLSPITWVYFDLPKMWNKIVIKLFSRLLFASVYINFALPSFTLLSKLIRQLETNESYLRFGATITDLLY